MFEETIYLPNYNNGLLSGERLYIGSWLISTVNTKNSEKFIKTTIRRLVIFSLFYTYIFFIYI